MTKEEDFKLRFATILADMREAGSGDASLVGGLADRVVPQAGHDNWTEFKATLSLPTYRALLTTFQNQGNALAKQGAMQRMRAIEVLACSLIARTQVQDAEVLADDRLLDILIDNAIRQHRGTPSADPVIS